MKFAFKNRFPLGSIIEFPDDLRAVKSDVPGCVKCSIVVNSKPETIDIICDYGMYINHLRNSHRRKDR